jgi:photoactive yellow protein
MSTYEVEIEEIDPASEGSWGTEPVSHEATPELDALSEAELDELSFGVICLHRNGTILRYNLAEARLARLDRAVVRGKHFFEQVAPCTARPEFQGRVEAFIDDRDGPREARFSYVFDFSFGAQLVTIELLRSSHPDRVYLVVNRQQVLPPRTDAFRPAPALTEWEGDAPVGVLRDARAQRYVQMPTAALAKLFQAARRLDVDTERLLEEWGVEWGRRTAIELEAWALEDHGVALRHMPIGDALALVSRTFSRQGWGTLEVDFSPSLQTGAFVLKIARSVWQDALRTSAAKQQRFNEGYFRALFTHLAGHRIVVRAVADDPSEEGRGPVDFLIVGEVRAEALAFAIAGEPVEGRTTEAVLRGLGKMP